MRLPSYRVLWFALGFYFLMHGLDFVSTMLGMQVDHLVEANPFMRDPETLKFIFWKGVQVKAVVGFFHHIIPAYFLFRAFRSAAIASLPFWYSGFMVSIVVARNFLLILE